MASLPLATNEIQKQLLSDGWAINGFPQVGDFGTVNGMNSSLRCDIAADVGRFATEVRPWLDAGPPTNQVLSTLIDQRATGQIPTEAGALWIKVLDGEDLIGVVVGMPPRGLLMTDLPANAVMALSSTIAEILPEVPAANGPKGASDHFSALWSIRTGCSARTVLSSRLYEVTDVETPDGVDGRRRAVTIDDQDLLADWMWRFAREDANTIEASGVKRLVADFEERIENGQPQWIWEADSVPVSFAMESPTAGGTVRIQAVYTPPESRRHGYAAANVAAISAEVLARPGVEHCTLYTDMANPTSNGVYRNIGYRPVADLVTYAFDYPTDELTDSSPT